MYFRYMVKFAQIFIPTSVIFDSLRFLIMFAAGILIGYLLTDIFCKKYWETGKVKSIIINHGHWKIHIHHWITGALIVVLVNWLGFTIPMFLLGFFDGIIIHDLVYKDKKNGIKWYNVIYKKENAR